MFDKEELIRRCIVRLETVGKISSPSMMMYRLGETKRNFTLANILSFPSYLIYDSILIYFIRNW